MKINVKFDQSALKRELQAGIDRVARDQTGDLDRLRRQYTGHPVAEIKPALQRLFARYNGKITDPELSEWAQLISDGTRIEMKPGRIR